MGAWGGALNKQKSPLGQLLGEAPATPEPDHAGVGPRGCGGKALTFLGVWDIHNHIVICTVNSETGKILDTKKKDIQRLHEISNAICRENGLSEMGKRVKEPDVKRKSSGNCKRSTTGIKKLSRRWKKGLRQVYEDRPPFP